MKCECAIEASPGISTSHTRHAAGRFSAMDLGLGALVQGIFIVHVLIPDLRLFYSFSNVGLVFLRPDIRAACTSLDCTLAEFHIPVYLRPR